MNNFENIRVGDIVYAHKGVRYGFNNNKYFYVQVQVTRVTKTQFTCENDKRYKKDSGREIGGSYGDRVEMRSMEVFDQTKEMNDFIRQMNKINKATTYIYELERCRNRVKPEIDIKLIEEFNACAEKLLLAIKE